MSETQQKGLSVSLETFNKYNLKVFGFKSEKVDGSDRVTFVWCKLCAKHKDAILIRPQCKGSARKALQQYIEGTTYVSKWNMERHIQGKKFCILCLTKSYLIPRRIST